MYLTVISELAAIVSKSLMVVLHNEKPQASGGGIYISGKKMHTLLHIRISRDDGEVEVSIQGVCILLIYQRENVERGREPSSFCLVVIPKPAIPMYVSGDALLAAS